MSILRLIADWSDRVIDESLDKDKFGVTLIKSAGVGLLEGSILGCAVVGAIGITISIVDSVIKK